MLFMLPLALLATVVLFDTPIADDEQRSRITDSTFGISTGPEPAETDSAATDSVSLERIIRSMKQ